MDVKEIKPRLLQRLDELGLSYKDFSEAIGKNSGWFSDVVTGRQKTTKPDVDRRICKTLGVTEEWLRGKEGPSLFAVATEPPPAAFAEYVPFRRAQIDAEIETLRARLRALEDERRQLIDAAKGMKLKKQKEQ